MRQSVDRLTIIGLAALLMPLLTMWHEIGGHAASCAAQGGQMATLGAFYVDCKGLTGTPDLVVALAGVTVNILLGIVAYAAWRGARGDLARLLLWLVWVSNGFVAAGYFLFSGVTSVGDLGVGSGGGLAPLAVSQPLLVRAAEIAVGGAAYILLVKAAIRALDTMIGSGPATRQARRGIAHVFYAGIGVGAVLVGLLNPVGFFVTIMSAAASSFGGHAGLISVGYADGKADAPRAFVIERSWPLIIAGAAVLAAFAIILGPSRHF